MGTAQPPSRSAPIDFAAFMTRHGLRLSVTWTKGSFTVQVRGATDDLNKLLEPVHALLRCTPYLGCRTQGSDRGRDGGLLGSQERPLVPGVRQHQLVSLQGDHRLAEPAWRQVGRATTEQIESWIAQRFRTAPMDVAIVGNFKERAVRSAVGDVDRARCTSVSARSTSCAPNAGGQEMVPFEHKVETESTHATVYLAWRIAHDPKQLADMEHAAYVLETRLFDTIRQEEGLAYRLSAHVHPHPYVGVSRLELRVSTDPARTKEVAEKTRSLVEALAKEGPTDAELATAKLQGERDRKARVKTIGFFRELTRARSYGGSVASALARIDALGSPDRARIMAALAATIQPVNYVEVIIQPD